MLASIIVAAFYTFAGLSVAGTLLLIVIIATND